MAKLKGIVMKEHNLKSTATKPTSPPLFPTATRLSIEVCYTHCLLDSFHAQAIHLQRSSVERESPNPFLTATCFTFAEHSLVQL